MKWWWIFKQDLPALVHDERRLLDAGWSPEMDFEHGRYRLSLHERDFDGRTLAEFETRDRRAFVAEIERLTAKVTSGVR